MIPTLVCSIELMTVDSQLIRHDVARFVRILKHSKHWPWRSLRLSARSRSSRRRPRVREAQNRRTRSEDVLGHRSAMARACCGHRVNQVPVLDGRPPRADAFRRGGEAQHCAPDRCGTRDNSLRHAYRGPRRVDRRGEAAGMRGGYLRGVPPRTRTTRQVDVLAAFVAAGGSVSDAAARTGIRPSTAKRHLADLRARSGLTTEQLIYTGRAEGWLIVPSLEPR